MLITCTVVSSVIVIGILLQRGKSGSSRELNTVPQAIEISMPQAVETINAAESEKAFTIELQGETSRLKLEEQSMELFTDRHLRSDEIKGKAFVYMGGVGEDINISHILRLKNETLVGRPLYLEKRFPPGNLTEDYLSTQPHLLKTNVYGAFVKKNGDPKPLVLLIKDWKKGLQIQEVETSCSFSVRKLGYSTISTTD
jgi:hypothetical protein